MMTRSRWSAWSPLLSLVCLSWLAAMSWAGESPDQEATGTKNRKSAVSYSKDIAPLVFRHCTSCHRPGEVAPFSLLTYRDLSKRTSLVRTVLKERAMPPWKAEPGIGHFADERRLTDDQIALVSRWIDDGAPEGDPADLPAAPKYVAGWKLGEPDLVITMAEPYAVEAEGPDVYRCFVLPLKVPAGKYLEAVEYRPGNRRVVHHAVLTTLPKRVAQAKLAEGDGKSFGSGLAPPGQLLPGQLAFWTPGMEPRLLPDGFAAEFPDESDLVMQLHLHPSGKPETEQSSIGFHFTERKPTGRLKLVLINNNRINIPVDDANYVVEASRTLPGPVDVYGVFPHMHLIGRSVQVTATLPDGTKKPLISIPDWDFNWQNYYQYAERVSLPAGTKVEGRWTFDNSADNPANPSHPPRRVSYGEQTTNEMAIVMLDVIPSGPETKQATPTTTTPKPPPSSEEVASRTIRVMERIDADQDGKLSLDELFTVVGSFETKAELQKRVAKFDRDNDQKLNPVELTEALKAFRKRPNSPER